MENAGNSNVIAVISDVTCGTLVTCTSTKRRLYYAVMWAQLRLHGRDTLMSSAGLVHEVTRNYHTVTKAGDILHYI